MLLIVFLFGLFEMIVEYVVLNDTLYLTTRFLVIAVVQLVLNLLFLPLFTFIITYYYIDWNGGKEAFQEEDWGAWEGWR